MRSLSFRYTFWSFLHLDVLFVREDTGVEVRLEGVALLAVNAESWLSDAAHIH